MGILLQILFINTDPPLHAWVCSLQQPFAGIPNENNPDELGVSKPTNGSKITFPGMTI